MTTTCSTVPGLKRFLKQYKKDGAAEAFASYLRVQAAGRVPTSLWDVLVWSEDFTDTSCLIFLPAGTALDEADFVEAKYSSKTWGQFCRLSKQKLSDFADNVAYPTLEDYLEDYGRDHLREDGEIDRRDARREYGKWGFSFRPPRAKDPFDAVAFEQHCFNCGPPEFSPRIAMSRTLSEEILDEFATLADGVWDGPYVQIPSESAPAVIAALEAGGNVVVHDPLLIDATMNDSPGRVPLARRRRFLEAFAQLMRDIETACGE